MTTNKLLFKSKSETKSLVIGVIAFIAVAILLYDMFHIFLLSFIFLIIGEILIFSLKEDFYFFENYFISKKIIFGVNKRVDYEQISKITLQKKGDIRFESDPKLIFHLPNKKIVKVVVEDDQKLIEFLGYLNNNLRIIIEVDSRNVLHNELIFNQNLKNNLNKTISKEK